MLLFWVLGLKHFHQLKSSSSTPQSIIDHHQSIMHHQKITAIMTVSRHTVSQGASYELVSELLRLGADVTTMDSAGLTLPDVARLLKDRR